MFQPLEDALVLDRHKQDSHTRRRWRYPARPHRGLHAALHNLFRIGAVRTIRRGTEAATRDLLDSVVASYASQRHYATAAEARAKQQRRIARTAVAAEGTDQRCMDGCGGFRCIRRFGDVVSPRAEHERRGAHRQSLSANS